VTQTKVQHLCVTHRAALGYAPITAEEINGSAAEEPEESRDFSPKLVAGNAVINLLVGIHRSGCDLGVIRKAAGCTEVGLFGKRSFTSNTKVCHSFLLTTQLL
jgi:hypothetical protein